MLLINSSWYELHHIHGSAYRWLVKTTRCKDRVSNLRWVSWIEIDVPVPLRAWTVFSLPASVLCICYSCDRRTKGRLKDTNEEHYEDIELQMDYIYIYMKMQENEVLPYLSLFSFSSCKNLKVSVCTKKEPWSWDCSFDSFMNSSLL